ncbi:MAG: acyltransferase [Weeksellaceae bacterium]
MERLKILDGLRVVAILMVMAFHYCYLFNSTLYQIDLPRELFKYGYLGVELFFIISGFVITLTLTKTNNFINFIKKRWIRLFPGMLICSVLTFSIISLFDTNNFFPNSKSVVNLIVSNTFVSPALINSILNTQTSFIDPPYWSLWVEIQFYILIGILYFLNKKHFIRNFTWVAVLLSSLFYFSHLTGIFAEKTEWFLRVVLEIFNFSQHALWFVLGVLIYKLYFVAKERQTIALVFIVALMQCWFLNFELYILAFLIFITFVFYCFLYNQSLLHFLTNSKIQKIGIASYSIYLIHQNIGLLFIEKLTQTFGIYNFTLPVLVSVGFCYIGVIIYRFFEKPIGAYFKKIMLQ